ncbi:MAG: iron-siderophore ABC transporter substrate-binding protein [Cyanobacteria bacterium P01_F01_bin.143]
MRCRLKPKQLNPVLVALLVTVLIVACQNNVVRQPNNSQLADCWIVKHNLGEVCVPRTPKRLVSLDNITLADASALGVPSVGVSLDDLLPEYLVAKNPDLELVGRSEQPNLEKIFQLNPDLIMGIEFYVEPIFSQLSQIAPTAVGQWTGYPDWREYFDFVAHVLGKEKEAQVVWASYNQRINQLKIEIGDHLQDMEISLAYLYGNGITIDAGNSFAGSILEDLGIRQAKIQVAVSGGVIPLSEERLDYLDTDILFLSVYRDEESENGLTNLQKKPLWNQLQVVQNQQVYVVDPSIWRGGHPLAANLLLDELEEYLLK